MSALLILLAAISVEVAATAALSRTEGFTNPGWSVFAAAGYVACAWLLALVVTRMQVSVAYAVWAGLGTASVALIGFLWLGESMDVAKAGGIGLIVAGVVLLNLSGAAH